MDVHGMALTVGVAWSGRRASKWASPIQALGMREGPVKQTGNLVLPAALLQDQARDGDQ